MKKVGVEFLVWLSRASDVSAGTAGPKAGLNVPCGECNLCCGSYLKVTVSEEESNRDSLTIEEYEDKDGNTAKRVLKDSNGTCVHLTGKGCSVYEDRPATCRVFDCRQRLVANVADKHTRPMVLQWDTAEWFTPENDIYIQAVRMAARNYAKQRPDAGVAETTQYAITNWHKYLGGVRQQVSEGKQSRSVQDNDPPNK